MKKICCLIFANIYLLSFGQGNKDKVRLSSNGGIDCFYKYDEQGRISQIQQSDKKYYEQYTYLGDTAIVKQYKDFSDSTLAGISLLNEKGLVDLQTNIYSKTVLIIQNKYDANNQLLSQKVSSDEQNAQYILINKNGNTIQQDAMDTIYENGKFQINKRIAKSTFSDKMNPLPNNVTGIFFKGKENKNQLISETLEIFSSDFCEQLPCPFLQEKHQLINYKYDYVLDEKGRLKIYTSTNLNTAEKSVTKYFYY